MESLTTDRVPAAIRAISDIRFDMKYRLLAVALPAILGLASLACSEGESIDPNGSPTGDVINRDVLLNNVEDVRAMIADNAPSLDAEMVGDVSYEDGRLRVVLAESLPGASLPDVDSVCGEISNAIALPGLSVEVESADGSESARCDFGS